MGLTNTNRTKLKKTLIQWGTRIMGHITATRNLVAIKVVRHAGQRQLVSFRCDAQNLVELDNARKHNISKFTTRTHHLLITKICFKDETHDVTCPLCASGDVVDEYHYLFHCDFFRNQREKFILQEIIKQPQTGSMGKLFECNALTNTARFV